MSEEEKVSEVAVEETTSSEETPKKKRSLRFKILMVVVIVVAVMAVAGGSVYLIFHSNPLFCNAVCHTPMDPYVTSFLEGKSVNDKQGALTADMSGSLIFHKETTEYKNGEAIVCTTCHDDGIDKNIQEGIAWVSGNYELPLTMQVASMEGTGDKNGVTWCLRDGCHTNDAGEPINDARSLQKATATLSLNPHAITKPSAIDQMQHERYWVEGSNGLIDCSTCHQTHEQSVMICTECHTEGGVGEKRIAEVPAGWLTAAEKIKQDRAK